MRVLYILSFLTWALFQTNISSSAQTKGILDPLSVSVIKLSDKTHYEITEKVDYFLDPQGILKIQDVSAQGFQSRFQKPTNPYLVDSGEEGVLWIRVIVENQRNRSHEAWFFESWGFDIGKITFFMPEAEGGFSADEAGYKLPFPKREIQHKNFNQILNIRPGETQTFFVKIERSYFMGFSFHLRSHQTFIGHTTNEYFLLGIYYGVLLIVLFFTLYLLANQKQAIYAYFAFFLLTCIWYSLARDGLGFQYIWPNFPELNVLTKRLFTQLLLVFSTLLFANHFVQKLKYSRLVNQATWGAIVLIIMLTLNQEYGYKIEDLLMLLTFSLILLVPILLMIRVLITSRQMSWPHAFAMLCMLIALLQSYASEANVTLFENPVINWYFANPVIFAEVVLFSISIFNQLGQLRKKSMLADKELNQVLLEKNKLQSKLNSKLKKKVKKRTEEINALAEELSKKNEQLLLANSQLQKLNQEVVDENISLSLTNKELKEGLEKTIQSMVLMKGFDFNEFKQIFPDKDACCKFLSELKWADGYHCRKCGYNKASISTSYGRRCRNCNYNESATSNTLFHKIKFPIEKAFYMLYLSNRKDVHLTLNELSEVIELRRETCWAFKHKIELAKAKIDFDGEFNGWEILALVELDEQKEG